MEIASCLRLKTQLPSNTNRITDTLCWNYHQFSLPTWSWRHMPKNQSKRSVKYHLDQLWVITQKLVLTTPLTSSDIVTTFSSHNFSHSQDFFPPTTSYQPKQFLSELYTMEKHGFCLTANYQEQAIPLFTMYYYKTWHTLHNYSVTRVKQGTSPGHLDFFLHTYLHVWLVSRAKRSPLVHVSNA